MSSGTLPTSPRNNDNVMFTLRNVFTYLAFVLQIFNVSSLSLWYASKLRSVT
ncbi:hypothetical protein CSC09_3497 [Escherichia coli]|nr:hypothetical protein CSC09_3497 [Escherichia coli]